MLSALHKNSVYNVIALWLDVRRGDPVACYVLWRWSWKLTVRAGLYLLDAVQAFLLAEHDCRQFAGSAMPWLEVDC
jgi:hypothetical protein